jgi:serine/threonine protein kinase
MIKLKRKMNGEIEDLCTITLDVDYKLQNERGEHLAGIKRGTTYKMMVMEYLCGGDLFEYVQEQRQLHIDDIHRIFVQIIDAVEFCNQKGVYHLDLKTENFVFADKEKTLLKIIDFGLAKEDNDICKGPRPFGTPGFFAPELFNDEEVSCSKCDIFSIGIILLKMVRSQIIYESERGLLLNTKDSYNRYVRNVREFIEISSLTPELKSLLLYMITIDPKNRYDIEEIKKTPWYKNEKLNESDIEELESTYRRLPGPYVAEQEMKGKKQKYCIIS